MRQPRNHHTVSDKRTPAVDVRQPGDPAEADFEPIAVAPWRAAARGRCKVCGVRSDVNGAGECEFCHLNAWLPEGVERPVEPDEQPDERPDERPVGAFIIDVGPRRAVVRQADLRAARAALAANPAREAAYRRLMSLRGTFRPPAGKGAA